MKFITFGCSGEERSNAKVGAFVPYAPGKGTGKFVSAGAGEDGMGGGFTEGAGQGLGLALGLIAAGTAYSWVKTRAVK